VVIAVVGILGQRADGHEHQVVGAEIDAAVHAVALPVDARGLLAPGGDVEVDVGHLGAVLELDAMTLQPLHQRQDQRFILVVAVNFSAEKSGRPPIWWMKRCR
jgi:hypothetical protein